jgi:hypothetical protein
MKVSSPLVVCALSVSVHVEAACLLSDSVHDVSMHDDAAVQLNGITAPYFMVARFRGSEDEDTC